MDNKAYLGQRKILGLNPNVFFPGIVSSEMIFTLVPLFLRNVLKAPFISEGID